MNILILLWIGYLTWWIAIILADYIEERKIIKEWKSLLSGREKLEERRNHVKFRPNLHETRELFIRAVNSKFDGECTYYYDSKGEIKGSMYVSYTEAYHYYYLNNQIVRLELKNINDFISENIEIYKRINVGDLIEEGDAIRCDASDYADELNKIINIFNQSFLFESDKQKRNKMLDDLVVRIKNEKWRIKK